MAQTSTLTASGNGLYTLHIQGHFLHPHWVAFLFMGLAEQQISVVSGRALQETAQDWDAHFGLNFERSKAFPNTVDFIALAENGTAAVDMEMPRLTSFTITQREQGLELLLVGPDQIGFLGRMLRRISVLALFPVDIEINTVAGSINDRIVFRPIGGLTISEGVRSLLETLLRELLV